MGFNSAFKGLILSLRRVASRDLNQFTQGVFVTLEYLNYAESDFKIYLNTKTDHLSKNY